jgi:hypothetical protein
MLTAVLDYRCSAAGSREKGSVMSDEKKPNQDKKEIDRKEIDQVSGGAGTHPIPPMPIRPGPPTHPGPIPAPTPPKFPTPV